MGQTTNPSSGTAQVLGKQLYLPLYSDLSHRTENDGIFTYFRHYVGDGRGPMVKGALLPRLYISNLVIINLIASWRPLYNISILLI